MKEDNFDVGKYKKKKRPTWKSSEQIYFLLKGIQTGAFSGVVSGTIFGLSIALYVLIRITRSEDFPLFPPSDMWNYLGGFPLPLALFTLVMFFTLLMPAVGMVFGSGFGFVLSRWHKMRFDNHLIHSWMAAWTQFLCIGCIFFIDTFFPGIPVFMTLCFSLIASLIGGYMGGRWLNSK